MTRPRLMALVIVAFAALAFAACGSDEDESINQGFDASQTPGATFNASAIPNTNCGDKVAIDSEEPVVKTYDAEPAMTIDPAKTYIATVKTERGDFKIKLRPDLAPHHVNSFVFLARDGYYDHMTFHRVLPGFVAQTGDPTGAGGGTPGYLLNDELTATVTFDRGIIGMARTTAPDTAGSQWFVTYARAANLDNLYSIFGEVIENGMDVVDCITPRNPATDPNAPPGDKVFTITIEES